VAGFFVPREARQGTRGHGDKGTWGDTNVSGGGWRASCLEVGTEPRAVLVASLYFRPPTANRFNWYG